MEIILFVAKWAFIAVGVVLIIIAALLSVVVGGVTLYVTAESILQSVRRRVRQLSVSRRPIPTRPPVRPAALKR